MAITRPKKKGVNLFLVNFIVLMYLYIFYLYLKYIYFIHSTLLLLLFFKILNSIYINI